MKTFLRRRKQLPVIFAVSGLLLLAIGSLWFLKPKGIQQPIPFNHKRHQEMGYSCNLCHPLVETHTQAGRPTIATCRSCHLSLEAKSPLARSVKALSEKEEEIPWVRLYDLPDHVFFSHRRHVTLAKLDCSVCHGKIGESEVPPERVAVKHTMKRCIACHKAKGVSTDCLSCHK